MKQVQRELDNLIEKVKQTDVYLEYEKQKERLNDYPELHEQIDAYRKKNFELQMNYQGNMLDDELEKFQNEYEDFRQIPLVHDFLSSELAFCRLVQEINTHFLEAMSQDLE